MVQVIVREEQEGIHKIKTPEKITDDNLNEVIKPQEYREKGK